MIRAGGISSRKFRVLSVACIFILAIFSSINAYAQQTYTATTCSGTAFTFNEPGAVPGETYDWSFPSTTGGTVTGASAQTGQTAVSQTLVNTTNTVPVITTYIVTTSQGTTFNLEVTVNPKPVVANVPVTICSGSSFTYAPINVPAGTTYTWSDPAPTSSPAGSINGSSAQAAPQLFVGGQTLNNPTTSQATIIYTVTPLSGSCAGNPFFVNVTVNPKPVLNNVGSSPVSICSGSAYGYTPNSLTTGTTYSWSRAVVTGINNGASSGSNNPNEVLTNVTNPPAAVTVNYLFTLSANGCSNTQTIPVIVNPQPVLSSTISPAAICSGAPFIYTAAATLASSPTFTWTRDVTANISGGTGSGSSANVNETLVNSTTQPISVTYRFIITDGVTGCVSTQQLVSVTVNPTPVVIGPIALSSCSGNRFYYAPSNVPNGTLYSWTTPSAVGIIGHSAQNGQFFVGQTLSGAGIATYDVIPNNNGCIGGNFQVVVTVTAGSSVPSISNTSGLNVCSGINLVYTPNSAAVTPTYTWTRFYTSGISPNTNTGTTSVNEQLFNSGTTPLTATYAFRTTDNTGCTNAQLITATVNPIATLTSSLSPLPICSNSTFNYTPLANVTGTSFSWTRGVFGTNAANSGSANGGNPGEVLVNVGTTALPVSYLFTLTTPSGCTNTQTVIVSVNPAPTLSSTLTPSAICSGATFNYTPASSTSPAVFSWARAVISSISNGATSGSGNPGEVLVNTGNTAVTVPYIYTISANGCSNTQTVSVVVNPAPNIANQSTITCSNTSLTVTPANVPIGTTYTWAAPTSNPLGSITINSGATGNSQSNITVNLSNGTTNPAAAVYNVTPSANGCPGSPFVLTVNVNIISSLSSSLNPPAICSNSPFSYLPTSNTTGSSFSWTRNPLSGISNPVATGTGNPNETLINTTPNTLIVPYTYALSTPDGCVSTQIVSVSVKPLPTLSSAPPNAICSGVVFNYSYTSATAGTTYSWSRAVVAGISNAAASGINNPAEVLINNTTNSVIVPYAYTLTANGCSNPQTVNLLVNPTPTIVDQVTSSCNNTAFTVSPANVPTGTTYTWTQPTYSPATSISNGSPQPIAQNTISQTLNNTTSSPATATYTVTPSAGACTGTSFLVTVTVNTATVLSTSLAPPAVCSNSIFTYNPASNTPGTSFSWTRATVPGISNTSAAGINNPNETLINITSAPVSVAYTYALNTPNACLNIQTVTVVVNPTPLLTSSLTPPAICSGSVFNYTPASATTGVTYSWNRTVQPSISNGPGAGSGANNPSELLVNTTINQVTVAYNYILTANSCTNAQTVSVIVNPTPTVGNQTQTICGNTVFNINPLNIPVATQYTWTLPSSNPAGAIGGMSAQGSPQNNIGQLLTNQTLNAATATYTVTPVANGCSGASFTAAVTVNPTPVIADIILNPVCSGSAFSYTPANVPTATTYTWGVPVIGPVNSLTGGSAQSINQALISQTLSSSNYVVDTAAYIVLPSTNGCAGNSFKITVLVKPVPVVANVRDTICTGSTFSVVPPSVVPLNTTYTWPAPSSVPFGSVVGGSPQTTGVPVISQTLFNSSNAIAQMVYTVTPSTAGCAGNPFTLVETVGIALAPIANQTATICSGTVFDVTPTTTPPNTTYTWGTPVVTPAGSVSGSSAASSRQTIISQTLTNLTGLMSSVVYTVVAYNTGCSSTPFRATINVRPVPKAAITGNAVICRYPFDTLTVNFAGQAPWSFDYLENGVPKTQTGITASPYRWILPANPAATRTVSITRVNDFACVDSVDTATFVQKINPLPVGQIISLHGPYICNNIIDTLFVSYPSSDTLQFQWTLNGVNLPGVTTDSIGTLTGGRYNTILTNQYGCVDTAVASVLLTVISQPKLNFTYDSYCINNLINFTNLTDTSFTGPIQWLWDMGDSTTRSTYHATDTYFKGGDRHIRLTATQLYCPANPTFIDSTISIQFPIAAVRMPSVSAYKGVSTPLAVRSIPGYRYLWTPTRGIDRPDSASVNFNYQVTQEYLINLISPAGCITKDSLLVRVFDDKMVNILVPKSFTPNGDGVNDVLYPYLAGIKTFKYFKVYNRFNQLMFETTNPDVGWNGSRNGTPQPMAIYIWVAVGIANDGSTVELKGQTLLLR
ncbi:MAG: PKD-like domain-containing protein [Bacteroidota bacterium]